MIINVANFNFDGGSGGGGKPALLQEKTVTIVENGSQTITPDEGFDGMSSVQINAAITSDSSAIDFSSIGYSDEFSAELNANMNADIAYSKTLYDKWNPNRTDAYNYYRDNKNIVYAPNIDTSNVTDMEQMFFNCYRLQTVPAFNTINVNSMAYMFYNCSSLTAVPLFNTINVNRMDYMLYGCSNITNIPSFNTSNVYRMDYMFYNCSSITTIPELDTRNVTNFYFMIGGCSSLTTIEGISFKSFSDSTMKNNYMIGISNNKSIRKAVFKDIGYQSDAVQFNTSKIDNWGVNTDEIPDARQSLIDSLITYSFDRASTGYPTCTITLSTNTKALLTEDEKAQITAKGFTIA